ncbi:hypothetical protein BATDEDRAFT_90278 [Batrachochytrium dendrobatidis JAM81]|uniref:non-specific serine/threonine protein kinase n=2 Tax=Batrachochytrium dendrobatidis TaxID=109871 RepID=F4P752_BATDJ|nr:uncharacterized protein BATDEDRAFT_90278 [Batrachochytrium dendrobatidis JAM81]EGF78827.1 hypothetical protein BATDEDRAFT_90278 [Batrachochytrium dendrobatidis JAM81]|eukprot:XP_006680472.1 hypothetical protein BATDEDRAFT_90278 [Batrachochytrium dendrobatidis JAM81]
MSLLRRVMVGTKIGSDTSVAIKILRREDVIRAQMTSHVRNEIMVMKRLGQHSNVVQMHDVMATSSHIYIVMDLVVGGEVLYHLVSQGSFSDCQSSFYFRQLIAGISFCHDNRICHRDIKPENMLLTDTGVLKITDFGLAAVVGDRAMLTDVAGTPAYFSPEMIVTNQIEYLAFSADIWACGVVLYLFLTGKHPFATNTTKQMNELIIRTEYKIPPSMSLPARELLQTILVRDPKRRAKISTIQKHMWLNMPIDKTWHSGQHAIDNGDQEGGNPKANIFELLAASGAFDISLVLNVEKQVLPYTLCTKFFSAACFETIIKSLTRVLYKMPVTFHIYEKRHMVSVMAPVENGMVVLMIRVYQTERGISLVDFKNYKGDYKEFYRIYRQAFEQLTDIIMFGNE